MNYYEVIKIVHSDLVSVVGFNLKDQFHLPVLEMIWDDVESQLRRIKSFLK